MVFVLTTTWLDLHLRQPFAVRYQKIICIYDDQYSRYYARWQTSTSIILYSDARVH